MGFLPVAIGAVGTVSQMVSQANAASSQRAAAREQQIAAEQQFALTQKRFQASKDQAAAMYQREAIVAEEMRNQALSQFEMAKAQQSIANIYEETNANIQDTNLRNQAQRLLGQAASVRGSASLSNTAQYEQLKAALGGDERAVNAFIQRAAAMGIDRRSNQSIEQMSLLSSINNYQRTLEASNTNTRVAGFQAGALEAEASNTEAYRQLTTQFMDTQRQIARKFQDSVSGAMPTLLDLQHQRNMVGLEAASKLRQAEMSLSQQASVLGYNSQQRALSAQINGMPSAAGAIFGGITGLASQVVPYILSQQNPQSIFNNQPTQQQPAANQYPVYEFGQRLPAGRAPAPIEFGQPLPRDNRLQDVTGRIYV